MQDFEKYLNELPVIPNVASKIMSIAEDNIDISFKELEEIISVDPMLTAKILKIANSALYARQNEIVNLQMAISLLGFKNIKSLVILLTASKFSRDLKNKNVLNHFWRHSLATAFISKYIMIRRKDRKGEEMAFIAGLLHDIGQVPLFQKYPDEYNDFILSQIDMSTIESTERSLFGTDHRILGGHILRNWNFPDIYSDTAEEHGSMNVQSVYKNIVYTVSLSDILTEKIGFGQGWEVDEKLYSDLIGYLDFDSEDVLYFQNDLVKVLENDPLFSESQQLFSV